MPDWKAAMVGTSLLLVLPACSLKTDPLALHLAQPFCLYLGAVPMAGEVALGWGELSCADVMGEPEPMVPGATAFDCLPP